MLLKKYCPSRLPGRRDQPDLNETRFSFFMGILVELYDHSYLSIPLADFYQIFFIQRQRYRDEKKNPKTVLFSSDTLFFCLPFNTNKQHTDHKKPYTVKKTAIKEGHSGPRLI